jgi:hypothetical protein
MQKELDKGIRNIVGCLTDPIIVMPGGWGEDIPGWMREAITIERLIAAKNGIETATDAEATWYLSSASLVAPLDHDWAQIYLYVARKTYETYRMKESGVSFSEDITVKELTPNQEQDLNHIKQWIYDSRLKHRKKMVPAAAPKETRESRKPELVQLTFGF